MVSLIESLEEWREIREYAMWRKQRKDDPYNSASGETYREILQALRIIENLGGDNYQLTDKGEQELKKFLEERAGQDGAR